MSLQVYMLSLTNEQLQELQSDILNAGIGKECKSDNWNKVFREKRKTAKGRRKKIYAALAQMSKSEMSRVSDALLTVKKDQELSHNQL